MAAPKSEPDSQQLAAGPDQLRKVGAAGQQVREGEKERGLELLPREFSGQAEPRWFDGEGLWRSVVDPPTSDVVPDKHSYEHSLKALASTRPMKPCR
jgi:hypothetical protein